MTRWIFNALTVGCLGTLVAGLLLLFRPNDASRFYGERLRQLLDWLYRPVRVERFIYRRHRWFGGFMILGALGSFVVLWESFGRELFTRHWQDESRNPEINFDLWLLESVMTLFIIFSALALVVGGVVTLRPSLLKGVERAVNQEVTREMVQQGAERIRRPLLQGLMSRPRAMALIIVAGSAFTLWRLAGYSTFWRVFH
ncbi:MAG: hypothetical protein HQL51_01270 [Magnetococcales bacterium]|nr:hypothetical protein [Magnetococcales bacterium]